MERPRRISEFSLKWRTLRGSNCTQHGECQGLQEHRNGRKRTLDLGRLFVKLRKGRCIPGRSNGRYKIRSKHLYVFEAISTGTLGAGQAGGVVKDLATGGPEGLWTVGTSEGQQAGEWQGQVCTRRSSLWLPEEGQRRDRDQYCGCCHSLGQ